MKKIKLKRISNPELIPIIVFSSVVPLIVYNKFSNLSEVVSKSSLGLSFSADPFSFYKMVLIIACAVLSLIILIPKMIKKEIKPRVNVIAAALSIYIILTILSAVFSEYPGIAFFGGPERMEGALTILSYFIMFIYILHVVDDYQKARTIFHSMMISAAVISIIGAIQFYGLDPYKSDFIRKLLNMVPTERFPYDVNTVQGVNTSYSTLASTNYMAMYLSLIIPFALGLYASVRSNGARLSSSLLIYLLLICLVGSASGGAYYAVGLSMVFILFLSFPYIKRNVVNMVMMSVIVIGLLLVTNIFMDNLIANRLNLKTMSYELAIGTEANTSIYIDDIVLGNDTVSIYTTDKSFTVINDGEKLVALTIEGSVIPTYILDEGDLEIPGDVYLFEDNSYSDYFMQAFDGYEIFAVKAGAREMFFYMTDDGIMVPGMANELQKIEPIERNQFIYENVRTFHGRGYIWATSLPMLKDTVILGNGPDTFFLHFPQNDVIGKINMTGRFSVVIGKPHNHYIQIAHDSGIIALLMMLVALGIYLIDSLILLIKYRNQPSSRILRTAAFCGVLGYLVSCLVFDSNVSTSTVFWTIFALGVTLNHQVRHHENGQTHEICLPEKEPV